MPDRYGWGRHSSDIQCGHIWLHNDEAEKPHDEIVDLAFPHIEEREDDPDLVQAIADVELLLARANGLIEAIGRVQRIRDEYVVSKMRVQYGELLDGRTDAEVLAFDASEEQYDASWDTLDRDEEDQIEQCDGAIEALDRIGNVLQILATGGEPEQGKSES